MGGLVAKFGKGGALGGVVALVRVEHLEGEAFGRGGSFGSIRRVVALRKVDYWEG